MLAGSAAAYEKLLIFLAHLAAETKTLTNRLTNTHTHAHAHTRTHTHTHARKGIRVELFAEFVRRNFLVLFYWWFFL